MNLEEILESVSFKDNYWVLIIPSVLMVIDFLTGLFNAWATGHLKSFKMREGLNHKMGELSVLLIGELFTYGMSLPFIFIKFVSLYIILMELISICENLDKMGVPIPKFVKKAFKNASDKLENDERLFDRKEASDDDSGGNTG